MQPARLFVMLTCSTEKFEKKLKFFPPADDTKDNFPCWANVRKIAIVFIVLDFHHTPNENILPGNKIFNKPSLLLR